MLIAALIYVSAVYITYLLLGIGVFTLAYTAGFAKPFYWFAAIVAVIAGLFEIKDYFWYGRGFSLQMVPGAAERIRRYTARIEGLESLHPFFLYLTTAALGIFVVLVELPCTGAPYLVILGLLAKGEYSAAVPLLLLYNLQTKLQLLNM